MLMTQDTSCSPGAPNWEKLSHEAKLRHGIPASLSQGMPKSGVVHNCKFRRKKKMAFDLQKNHIFTHTYAISSLALQLLFNKERDKTRRWNLKNREKKRTSHFPSCPTNRADPFTSQGKFYAKCIFSCWLCSPWIHSQIYQGRWLHWALFFLFCFVFPIRLLLKIFPFISMFYEENA